MRDPATMPVVRVEFTLPDGSLLERDWLMSDPNPVWLHGAPPDWLEEPGRKWDHPQDPVTLTGKVKAGREAEARAVVNEGRADEGQAAG